MKHLSYQETPVCPYCSEKKTDYDFFDFVREDGDNVKAVCGACSKEYIITLHTSYTFSSKKTKEES